MTKKEEGIKSKGEETKRSKCKKPEAGSQKQEATSKKQEPSSKQQAVSSKQAARNISLLLQRLPMQLLL